MNKRFIVPVVRPAASLSTVGSIGFGQIQQMDVNGRKLLYVQVWNSESPYGLVIGYADPKWDGRLDPGNEFDITPIEDVEEQDWIRVLVVPELRGPLSFFV